MVQIVVFLGKELRKNYPRTLLLKKSQILSVIKYIRFLYIYIYINYVILLKYFLKCGKLPKESWFLILQISHDQIPALQSLSTSISWFPTNRTMPPKLDTIRKRSPLLTSARHAGLACPHLPKPFP
jgi:hypothetical protein